jgi:hypothetical protein
MIGKNNEKHKHGTIENVQAELGNVRNAQRQTLRERERGPKRPVVVEIVLKEKI